MCVCVCVCVCVCPHAMHHRGIGHGRVHYKALLKIIAQSAVLLPVDYDILYMDDCIYDQLYSLLPQEGSSGHPIPLLVLIYFSTTEQFSYNKNHLIIKYTRSRT